jgi:hypothetical protein
MICYTTAVKLSGQLRRPLLKVNELSIINLTMHAMAMGGGDKALQERRKRYEKIGFLGEGQVKE